MDLDSVRYGVTNSHCTYQSFSVDGRRFGQPDLTYWGNVPAEIGSEVIDPSMILWTIIYGDGSCRRMGGAFISVPRNIDVP